MTANAYLTNDVTTASAEMLVQRLLEKAIRSANEARKAEPGSGGESRAMRLRRAFDIVVELQNSLDFERGGEIALNLDALYEFIRSRLVAAGLSPSEEPIDEAVRILDLIAETWRRLPDGANGEGELDAGGL
ncbi:MAG: flagellar export chaperone FliS [Myxococcales bacterium]|nr:flagellar export chaperone FliS [Myxococcales bacterium]